MITTNESCLLKNKVHARQKSENEMEDMLIFEFMNNNSPGRIIYANHSLCSLLGYTRRELLSKAFFDVISLRGKSDRKPFCAKKINTLNSRMLKAHGLTGKLIKIPIRLRIEEFVYEDRKLGIVFVYKDSLDMNLQLQTIIEHLPDATFAVDRKKRVIVWNKAIEELTGVSKQQMIGKDDSEYAIPFFGEKKPMLVDMIIEKRNEHEKYKYLWSKGETLYAESFTPFSLRGQGGHNWSIATPIYSNEGELVGAIESIRDMSERVAVEKQLEYLATHDSLTAVPNRANFEEVLNNKIANSAKGITSALFFLDIDNFKKYNDTLGHIAGDQILIALANTIKKNLRDEDFFARLGGDEFAIIVEKVSEKDARKIAEKLRQVVSEGAIQLLTHGINLKLSISIGGIMIDREGKDQQYMTLADAALYAAKEKGRDRVIFASNDEGSMEKMTETGRLVSLVKKALSEKRFILVFQPIRSVAGRETVSHEALLRLVDQEGAMITTTKFLTMAERFGLMPRIDLWVVIKALQELRKYSASRIFVNISAYTLADERMLILIEKVIKRSKIDPGRLGFEITEATLVRDILGAERWIKRLKFIGCVFALDNFGTGFSSFAYVHMLPIDYIKIDGSYIDNIEKEPVHRAMIEAINLIAKTLNKKTIAKNVENEEAMIALEKIGIDYAQGYHLGDPALLEKKML